MLAQIMAKEVTLLSLKNQDWKKIKVKSEKVNKLLKNISTDNITELNELIYAGEKLVSDKIGIPQKKPNRNTKVGWEMKLEGQIKKLRQQAKLQSKEKKTQEHNGRKRLRINSRQDWQYNWRKK